MTWLSPASLKSAEAKLANMVDLIGYPKLVLNSTWLDSVYSDVDVSDDDYLVNRKKTYLLGRRVAGTHFPVQGVGSTQPRSIRLSPA